MTTTVVIKSEGPDIRFKTDGYIPGENEYIEVDDASGVVRKFEVYRRSAKYLMASARVDESQDEKDARQATRYAVVTLACIERHIRESCGS
jgi:hypothetical protein